MGDSDNTNGDDTPSNTPATDNAAEEAEIETVLELGTEGESAEDKSTSGSAEDKVSPPYESATTSQRTRTLPNGLTVTVHAEDEAATNLVTEGTAFFFMCCPCRVLFTHSLFIASLQLVLCFFHKQIPWM